MGILRITKTTGNHAMIELRGSNECISMCVGADGAKKRGDILMTLSETKDDKSWTTAEPFD